MIQVSAAVADKFNKVNKQTEEIQARLVKVNQVVLEALGPGAICADRRCIPMGAAAHYLRLRQTGHRFSWDYGNTLSCSKCGSSVRKGALKAFLKKGNCTEMLRLSHHLLRPAPGQVVMVGAQQLHESHKLIYMGGFWYCGNRKTALGGVFLELCGGIRLLQAGACDHW